MKVIVFSDVHGNLPALEYLLKKEKTADLIISLGDVVNYGPWGNECVDILETIENRVLLMGNHEKAFISGEYTGNNTISRAFFNHCISSFDKKNKIEKYLEFYTLFAWEFKHTLNDIYIYPDTDISLSNNTFIGHSHRIFLRRLNKFRLVNVGSLGQNRLNLDTLNYVIWDTERDIIELVNTPFSADKLMNEIKIRKYPSICIDYLQSKRLINK